MRNRLTSKVPVPEEKTTLISADEVQELKAKTVLCDPMTGKSIETVKYTYADIVKGFGITAPSEIYTPSEEEIAYFKKVNPFVSIDGNHILERNPASNELDEKCEEFIMPEPSELFHKLNKNTYDC